MRRCILKTCLDDNAWDVPLRLPSVNPLRFLRLKKDAASPLIPPRYISDIASTSHVTITPSGNVMPASTFCR
jgi:hypothetical protein